MDIFAIVVFLLGALFCVLNIYTSFLRYPIHKWILKKPEYKHVSGAPLLGTIFVGMSLIGLHDNPWFVRIGLFLILFDTGGPHWFIFSMIYNGLFRKTSD